MTHPTYDQLHALPSFGERRVPMQYEDINGHLNIRHYVGIASEGLDESLISVGIEQLWPQKGHAVFTVEHHMAYLNELRTGDEISVRVRLVGRSDKAAHVLVYLLDDTHRQVSYAMEEICVHIDMETRRTAPWPDDVAAKLDARIAEHRAYDWPADLSGSVGLR